VHWEAIDGHCVLYAQGPILKCQGSIAITTFIELGIYTCINNCLHRIKEAGKVKFSIFRHLEGCHCVSKERFDHIRYVTLKLLMLCLTC